MLRKIHPVGFRGFLAARSVPMTANPIGRITSTGSASSIAWIAERFAISSATVVTHATSQKAASGHARRVSRAGRSSPTAATPSPTG